MSVTIPNQELVEQGVANLVGPFFGCIPVTGGVARSIVNVRSEGCTPVADFIHALLLLALLLAAAPLVSHIPLATLSAILVVAAYRMVSWKQFFRLAKWPFSDSSVFLATFTLIVLADPTLAAEVSVALAALLIIKSGSETSQITAVDERTETEGSYHSLVGKHLILSAPHTQPLLVVEKAGFLDRIGRENVCPHIDAALARARDILGLPPAPETDPLHQERQRLEAVRRELSGALERANEVMQTPTGGSRALSPQAPGATLGRGNGKSQP